MRVWRCFIRIVRLYLKYCIVALSILFCFVICDSIIYVISVITYIFSDGKIHCLMCVDCFPLWTLIDSFVRIGIVHGILFNNSGWYHQIWCILYTSKVIKGSAMHMLPGSVGVACSPILSVCLEGMGCEPVSTYSYFWWGCEYNVYLCWQNYTFRWIIFLDGPLLDSTSDYGKCNILF